MCPGLGIHHPTGSRSLLTLTAARPMEKSSVYYVLSKHYFYFIINDSLERQESELERLILFLKIDPGDPVFFPRELTLLPSRLWLRSRNTWGRLRKTEKSLSLGHWMFQLSETETISVTARLGDCLSLNFPLTNLKKKRCFQQFWYLFPYSAKSLKAIFLLFSFQTS